MAIENPFGAELTEYDVRDWFYLVAWLRYKTYGYSRHKMMIARWWAGASAPDVRQAREIRLRREGKVPPVFPLNTETRTALPLTVDERPQMQRPRQRRRKAPESIGALLDDLFEDHG